MSILWWGGGGTLTLAVGDNETKLFTLMQHGNGLLIDATNGAASRIAKEWASRVSCVEVQDGTTMLLRPDACIAWVGGGSNQNGLELALKRWFGKPGGELNYSPDRACAVAARRCND